MRIDTLLSQHRYLLDIVDRIAGLRPEKDAMAIAEELARLAMTLLQHCEVEDRHLYPVLRQYGDRPDAPIGLKVNIKNFFDEMEAFKPIAQSFLAHWSQTAIAQNPQDFREAFAKLSDTLGQRIAREESRLYPLYTEHVLATTSS